MVRFFIANTLQWLKTAKEISDELEERYGQTSCAQLFSVQEKISKVVQSSDETVETFFVKMKGLWDELDNLYPAPTCTCFECTRDIRKKIVKIQQGRRLIEFLMKLNPKYQHIRSNILSMKELPSAAKAYRILMQEQTHQELSKTTLYEDLETHDACRLEKRKFVDKAKNVQNKKGSHFCEHCKVHGHSMERCWKIHGFPANYRPNIWRKDGPNKANTTHVSTQSAEKNAEPKLTQKQYDKLMSLLNTQSNKTEDKESTIAASAHSEGQCSLKPVWILDSGTTDHICCDINIFKHYSHINKQFTIVIPDGSHVLIKYIGTIELGNGLKLNKVLYVPGFQYNLISIYKLCQDQNVKISFITNMCVM